MSDDVVRPGEGRAYDLGPRMSAVFKAETPAYSISEWWMEPDTDGPGAHSHPEDDLFYVLEGTLRMFMDGEWFDASAGAFVRVPGGVTHDFQNRSPARVGFLNISTPGGFEADMPGIAEWFKDRDAPPAGR